MSAIYYIPDGDKGYQINRMWRQGVDGMGAMYIGRQKKAWPGKKFGTTVYEAERTVIQKGDF